MVFFNLLRFLHFFFVKFFFSYWDRVLVEDIDDDRVIYLASIDSGES